MFLHKRAFQKSLNRRFFTCLQNEIVQNVISRKKFYRRKLICVKIDNLVSDVLSEF